MARICFIFTFTDAPRLPGNRPSPEMPDAAGASNSGPARPDHPPDKWRPSGAPQPATGLRRTCGALPCTPPGPARSHPGQRGAPCGTARARPARRPICRCGIFFPCAGFNLHLFFLRPRGFLPAAQADFLRGFCGGGRACFFLPVKNTGSLRTRRGAAAAGILAFLRGQPARCGPPARIPGSVPAAARLPWATQKLPCPGHPGGARARFWRLIRGRRRVSPPGVRAAAGSFPGPQTPVRAAAPGQPAAVRRTGGW